MRDRHNLRRLGNIETKMTEKATKRKIEMEIAPSLTRMQPELMIRIFNMIKNLLGKTIISRRKTKNAKIIMKTEI